MRSLRYALSALEDFDRITEFITREGEGLPVAMGFVEQLKARCIRLAELPGTLGTDRPDLGKGLRSIPHRRYVIFFRYAEDAVEIVNVLSGRMDVIGYFSDDH